MIHDNGRLYLSDLMHTLATSPAAKTVSTGAEMRPVPVLIELVSDDGSVIGFGHATGFDLIPSSRPDSGVLVIRGTVREFRPRLRHECPDAPEDETPPQIAQDTPPAAEIAFDGTYPHPSGERRISLKDRPPPGSGESV